MKALPIFAVILLALWVVLRIVLKVTGILLHLFWIAAVVVFILWLIGKVRR